MRSGRTAASLWILFAIVLGSAGLLGQTRIEPPGPRPGPGWRPDAPILFPLLTPRVTRPHFDLFTPPSTLWAVAWAEHRMTEARRRGFARPGAFGLHPGGFRGAVGWRGAGGPTRIDAGPAAYYWAPWGAYGYGGGYGDVAGYGYFVESAPSVAPSNPYGPYAPWAASPGNPYGPYASPPQGAPRPVAAPEKP